MDAGSAMGLILLLLMVAYAIVKSKQAKDFNEEYILPIEDPPSERDAFVASFSKLDQ